MLEKIKCILNITDANKDTLLGAYIEQAKTEFELYTHRIYTADYDGLLSQMVIEKYNRRFNEGISSTSASGVSTGFKDGYSKEIIFQLNALQKRVKIL